MCAARGYSPPGRMEGIMKLLLKPFALLLALALTLINFVIVAIVKVFCLMSILVFLVLGICFIVAIVEKMWMNLAILVGLTVIGTALFFFSAAASASICNLRNRLVAW